MGREDKKRSFAYILILLLAFLILCWLFKKTGLLRFFLPIYQIESRVDNVSKVKKSYKDEKVVGWIRVQGTNIDYPIIYNSVSKDRDFNHAWVNDDLKKIKNYIPIFGHNIRNVSSQPIVGDKTMERFEQLMSYIYYDFGKDNKYIQITIDNKDYLYQIFSVSLIPQLDLDYHISNYSKEKMKKYLKKSLNDSYFKYNVKVNENDKIVSLITCTRFNGELFNDLKIDAKLVENKKIGYNYGITEKTDYKEIKKILEGDGENG